ncbi:MAG: hypothetical protein GX580_07440 [Candidatus Hydrogenedens sp.]|nr:PmoA family protein [Candidatus Hydrogenedentota bacterium]NLF57454.1 hypothetical protein [Candidatus Hydrogenedens sp.]
MARLSIVAFLLALSLPVSAQDASAVAFQETPGQLTILVGGRPFAEYVYADKAVPRPFFCRVTAPDGTQVTRNYPPDPVADKGNDDHEGFHPGIWLAFGDLGGADFWRNKARVRHDGFINAPKGGDAGAFTVRNVYETTDAPPRVICEETCTYTVRPEGAGIWLVSESTFQTTLAGVAFGDQEEMGFGVRMATPLTVKHGNGVLLNSLGGENERDTWGKAADWCAFSGMAGDHRAGVMLMASPKNFRPSWHHNRDYGLMVANPFGKKSMTAPKDRDVTEDSTPLPAGEPLTLGFAVFVFSTDSGAHPDYSALHAAYAAGLN